MQNFDKKKQQFFEFFVKNTLFDDVSISAMEKSSLDLKMDSSYHKILFPNGLAEVVEYYYQEQLIKYVVSNIPDIPNISSKVKSALNLAIIDNPFPKEFRKKLARFYLSPLHMKMPAKFSWYFADVIWNHLNDKSIDYNYYSKRSILFSIYSSSVLYYLQDNSENHEHTRNFIDKSLTKIRSFGKVKQKIISSSEKLKNIPVVRMFF